MGNYDIQNLLSVIDPANPGGKDITYEPSFLELEKQLQKSSSNMLGQEVDNTQSLNWQEIASKSYELMQMSKNLRVAVYFAFSLFKLNGFSGLSEGLILIKGLLDNFWDNLYPPLDPEDGNDPIGRINILRPISLENAADQSTVNFIRAAIESPVCISQTVGIFTYRDYQIASGVIKPIDESVEIPTVDIIRAAIKDTPDETMKGLISSIEDTVKILKDIQDVFSRCAQGQSPNFDSLESTLLQINRFLKSNFADQQEDVSGTVQQTGLSNGPAVNRSISEIKSKNDIVCLLDKMCDYFKVYEPSSPVPLLLRRAQKLVSKNFMEVIEDLCPDALNQIKMISGNEEQKET